jgi:hypothetical protein
MGIRDYNLGVWGVGMGIKVCQLMDILYSLDKLKMFLCEHRLMYM